MLHVAFSGSLRLSISSESQSTRRAISDRVRVKASCSRGEANADIFTFNRFCDIPKLIHNFFGHYKLLAGLEFIPFPTQQSHVTSNTTSVKSFMEIVPAMKVKRFIVLRKFMNHGKKVSALDWMRKDMTNEIVTH